MKEKSRVIIIGNYNAGNIGDDSLLEAVKAGFKSFLPNFKYWVMAPSKPYDYVILPTGLRSFLKFNWVRSLYAFYKAEYVVFGGGGLLNPEEYRSLYIWGMQIRVAKFFKCKVVLLANSFPVNNSKLFLEIIKKVDFITARDSASFNFLNKLEDIKCPVRQTLDLALSLDLRSKVEDFEFDSSEFVVLNLRSYANVSKELQINFFVNLVEQISQKTNLSIYLLPFDKGDVKFLRELNNQVKDNGRVFLLPFESDVLISALAKAKTVISQRLHPNLFAIALNKPFIALSYSSKVSSILNDLGFDDNVFKIDEDLEAHDLSAIVYELIHSESNTSTILNAELKKKAEDNFRLLSVYFDSN